MRVLNVIIAWATSQGMRVVVGLSPFLLIFFYPGCVPRVGEVQQDDHLHQQEQARAKAGQLPCAAQAQRDEKTQREAQCDKPSNCLVSATWSRAGEPRAAPLRVTQCPCRAGGSSSGAAPAFPSCTKSLPFTSTRIPPPSFVNRSVYSRIIL
jgi:hypothetical protein